ncbi:MAG: hypothetical protein IPL83_06325 [Bdellovibrionales bacterium]|nr:hypothetical protein [Bdellovibrionales bacterium]
MKAATEEIDPLYRKMLPLRITKGEIRKVEIIKAAVECLAEGGYEHFNYNTIGLKAGLLVPTSLTIFLISARFCTWLFMGSIVNSNS